MRRFSCQFRAPPHEQEPAEYQFDQRNGKRPQIRDGRQEHRLHKVGADHHQRKPRGKVQRFHGKIVEIPHREHSLCGKHQKTGVKHNEHAMDDVHKAPAAEIAADGAAGIDAQGRQKRIAKQQQRMKQHHTVDAVRAGKQYRGQKRRERSDGDPRCRRQRGCNVQSGA